MRTVETLRRSAVAVTADRTVTGAAAVMEAAGVGALGVLDDQDRLVGVVTDRDLVRRVLARGCPGDARVDSVMTSPALTVEASSDLHEAFAVFRRNAVRRLCVVDGGRFVGMISVDDLLVDVAADLSDLARPVAAEILFAHRDPSPPAVVA